jgi:membrane protein required for colicin V production
MSWVDLTIVGLLLIATLGGMAQGFLRSFCSLAGLVLGLAIAAWNYHRVAAMFVKIVRDQAIANVIGFLLVAILIMVLANVIGALLEKTIHWMGLGCLDKIAGAVFGFLQGALLVMICILVTVAFFPQEHWLAEAQLPKMFFGACHVSSNMTPGELKDKVKSGMNTLEHDTQKWMNDKSGES